MYEGKMLVFTDDLTNLRFIRKDDKVIVTEVADIRTYTNVGIRLNMAEIKELADWLLNELYRIEEERNEYL